MIINISEQTPAGFEDFLRRLEALPVEAQRKILMPGVRILATDFKKIAIQQAPVGRHKPLKYKGAQRENGFLRKSIFVQTKMFPEGPRAWTKVGAFYARFLEWGTKKIRATHWLKRAYMAADPERQLERELEAMARKLERMMKT